MVRVRMEILGHLFRIFLESIDIRLCLARSENRRFLDLSSPFLRSISLLGFTI